MAHQVVGTISTAVAAVVTHRAVSKFLENFNQQMATDVKLQQLELLLTRIRSTVQVSEKYALKSTTLVQWREKLKEAASHGDEVLLRFKYRAPDEAAHQNSNNQHGTGSTTLYFTRNVWSNIARCIRATSMALFSSDEDMKKLNSALEALEKASENIGEFIGLLRLEASPNLKRRCRMVPTIPSGRFGDSQYFLTSTKEILVKDVFLAETVEDEELLELTKLAQRLNLG